MSIKIIDTIEPNFNGYLINSKDIAYVDSNKPSALSTVSDFNVALNIIAQTEAALSTYLSSTDALSGLLGGLLATTLQSVSINVGLAVPAITSNSPSEAAVPLSYLNDRLGALELLYGSGGNITEEYILSVLAQSYASSSHNHDERYEPRITAGVTNVTSSNFITTFLSVSDILLANYATKTYVNNAISNMSLTTLATTRPQNPVPGSVYFDTTTKCPLYYTGNGVWVYADGKEAITPDSSITDYLDVYGISLDNTQSPVQISYTKNTTFSLNSTKGIYNSFTKSFIGNPSTLFGDTATMICAGMSSTLPAGIEAHAADGTGLHIVDSTDGWYSPSITGNLLDNTESLYIYYKSTINKQYYYYSGGAYTAPSSDPDTIPGLTDPNTTPELTDPDTEPELTDPLTNPLTVTDTPSETPTSDTPSETPSSDTPSETPSFDPETEAATEAATDYPFVESSVATYSYYFYNDTDPLYSTIIKRTPNKIILTNNLSLNTTFYLFNNLYIYFITRLDTLNSSDTFTLEDLSNNSTLTLSFDLVGTCLSNNQYDLSVTWYVYRTNDTVGIVSLLTSSPVLFDFTYTRTNS